MKKLAILLSLSSFLVLTGCSLLTRPVSVDPVDPANNTTVTADDISVDVEEIIEDEITEEVVETTIEDKKNQLTKISKIFQENGKRFGEFDYIQDEREEECGGIGICPYKNDNKLIRTIEIYQLGDYVYYLNGTDVYSGGFEHRYTTEHPYSSTWPEKGNFDGVFILDIKDGKIISIKEDYIS